jgi:hypothetical protein
VIVVEGITSPASKALLRGAVVVDGPSATMIQGEVFEPRSQKINILKGLHFNYYSAIIVR